MLLLVDSWLEPDPLSHAAFDLHQGWSMARYYPILGWRAAFAGVRDRGVEL